MEEVRKQLIEVFKRWGQPGAIRVDNGQPFGDPTGKAVSVLALWLIAMDVDMIWNKPYCPQMNAVVEKMQDTTSRWAEVSSVIHLQELQCKLEEALVVQREQYPVERLQNKTRVEAFPELKVNSRLYDEEGFKVQRIYDFLSTRVYTRKVSGSGQIEHFGQRYTVTYRLRHQEVQLRLSKDGRAWEVLHNYTVVKKLPADNLFEDCVRNLTVFQRTDHPT